MIIIRSYVNLELSEVVIGCSSRSIKKWEKMLNCVVMMIIIAVDDVGKRNLISGSFFFNETAFHCSTTTTTLTWILCKIISLQINFISSNSFSIFLSTPFLFYLLKALIFSTELNLSLHLNDEFWIYSLSHDDNFMNDNFEVVFNDDDDVKNYLHQNLLHISKCCC